MSQSNALRRSEAYAEPATQDFSIRPLAAVTGAEIVGIDLSRELAPADFAKVHRAHLDHHLLVFRDQRITPQQHIDFSRRFDVCTVFRRSFRHGLSDRSHAAQGVSPSAFLCIHLAKGMMEKNVGCAWVEGAGVGTNDGIKAE